jgi:hypothetical protein
MGWFGLGFAGDDGRLEFVASHPFARKSAAADERMGHGAFVSWLEVES